jgi:N-acyl-D-aspartate/D-glutamate deacylase
MNFPSEVKGGLMQKRSYTLASMMIVLCLIIMTGLFSTSAAVENADYDLIIRNAKVFDGSANPPFMADVAVKGSMIVSIADPVTGNAARIIDAQGLHISPGFIDLHTHADGGMYYPENRAALNYLTQGVTSLVVGQCGSSAWPLFEKASDQISRWTEEGIGPNVSLLVGHGSVRQLVMGMENRPPRSEELEEMKSLVKEAMEQGAVGISTGLIYLPGRYSESDEVIELAKVVAPYGGIYHTHIRDERDKLLEAVEEAIEIAEKANIPTHISHLKVMGVKNWGLVKEACSLIEEARGRGIQISADQYPYPFANGYPYRSLLPAFNWTDEIRLDRLTTEDVTSIFDLVRDDKLLELYKKITPFYPLNEHHQQYLDSLSRQDLVDLMGSGIVDTGQFRGMENPRERMFFLEWMKDPELSLKIRERVESYIDETLGGPENVVVGICVERSFEGKTLKQVAALRGKSVLETAIELELIGSKCIPLQMGEEDIEYIMKKEYVGTGSDGTVPFYGIGLVHIRSYSTFFHKIKKYALERNTVSVPHVIRSQTSLPAKIMNWDDRGWIKEGYKADLIVFDLEGIKTPASISNPHQKCKGVKYLLINGKLVIDNENFTGELPGQVLKLR